jgi:hypothetical protein
VCSPYPVLELASTSTSRESLPRPPAARSEERAQATLFEALVRRLVVVALLVVAGSTLVGATR